MSLSADEDSESCAVCIERPRTVRFRPCGHAVCCDLCTIKACEPSQRRLKCPTCREAVAQLELVPNIGERMESYEAAAQPGVLSYEGVPVFLQAMFNSAAREVADEAHAVHGRWGGLRRYRAELESGLRNAANTGNAEAVTALLTVAPGLNVNAADGAGNTALTIAAMRGHTETVTALLTAPDLDANPANVNGLTALMLAVMGGHTETITTLLAAPGLVVNTAEGDGWTALMQAAARGYTKTVTALLAAPDLDVNAENGSGQTAVMMAAGFGHSEAVTALLAAPGLDVNAENGSGQTALMLAAGFGHTEAVTALMTVPGLDVNAANEDGTTALILAVARGHGETATALQLAS